MTQRRHWVIVASRDHALRGVQSGFIMANHGKRAPLARMSVGDGILIYSPTTTYPRGTPLRAITIVGEVTGTEPEPSEAIRAVSGGPPRCARSNLSHWTQSASSCPPPACGSGSSSFPHPTPKRSRD